jgi:RNA polymerase sigma-70 factor (ECF subfamily)
MSPGIDAHSITSMEFTESFMESDPTSDALADGEHSKCIELVLRIRQSEDGGMEDLYRLFSKGVRFYLYRHLGTQDLDDRIHDTFVIVVQAIRNGELREPERLMGFVRTVVRRQVAAHIDRAVQQRKEHAELDHSAPASDHRGDPERSAIDKEHEKVVEAVLRSVSSRDREILTRFYLQEQTQEQICREMNLSDTQFRLLKSRAKARFAEMGRRKLGRRKNV